MWIGGIVVAIVIPNTAPSMITLITVVALACLFRELALKRNQNVESSNRIDIKQLAEVVTTFEGNLKDLLDHLDKAEPFNNIEILKQFVQDQDAKPQCEWSEQCLKGIELYSESLAGIKGQISDPSMNQSDLVLWGHRKVEDIQNFLQNS